MACESMDTTSACVRVSNCDFTPCVRHCVAVRATQWNQISTCCAGLQRECKEGCGKDARGVKQKHETLLTGSCA